MNKESFTSKIKVGEIMPRTSKNTFTISGNHITISHPDWDFIATATIRGDYAEEFQSVTWSKKGDYLYNEKLGGYLHIYIMRKWYGEEIYNQMSLNGYIVDHMDNNGYNCCVENLFFLLENENKAKGFTVDQYNEEKTYMALTLFRDFETKHIQITIVFNYPAIAKISSIHNPALIDLVYLLYDRDYPEVINDARTILYDYKRDYTFEPEKLHFSDYHIEGTYGAPVPKEIYDKYIEGSHGHTVFFFNRKAPMLGWRVEEQRQFFKLRGEKSTHKLLCE